MLSVCSKYAIILWCIKSHQRTAPHSMDQTVSTFWAIYDIFCYVYRFWSRKRNLHWLCTYAHLPLLPLRLNLLALLTAAYSVVFDMEQRERERKRSAKLCKSLDSFFPSKNVAIPFLDHILFNLYSWFSPLSTTATSLLTLVPAIIWARNGELGNTIQVYHDAWACATGNNSMEVTIWKSTTRQKNINSSCCH